MDLRLALYELAMQQGLDAGASSRLQRLAGLDEEPASLAATLPRVIAVLGAALGGLGIVFWIAANWDAMGRWGRFALLQSFLAVMCVGALWRPAARVPLSLLALLATGALFAYFGQTYQTGADAWQLFALWALLTLPLAIAVRSDVLWTPWVLIALTAIALWVQAHTGHRWRVEPDDLRAHLVGWLLAAALLTALAAPLRRFSGAGLWSLRTGFTLWVVLVASTALGGLFHREVAPHYAWGLGLFAIAAAALATRRWGDVYGLSAVALGLDTLLVAGLARMVFEDHRGDWVAPLLLVGLAAAGLLAATVSVILKLSRRAAEQEGSA
ncbi:DUF2157 domain-containing protein [Piscinibacter sp. XHJ-5]|uniref:DUF2157 domain-containing protein n=1 Tax=Piscinibacter sp. XHJ-5 TaxID=3037797 RepID=UPI0024534314|nr:DUF2157 domain-containing protein [Piscinibacter sp. XHJ-5]